MMFVWSASFSQNPLPINGVANPDGRLIALVGATIHTNSESSYVGNIADLKKEPHHPKSIACLNKMVENALQHLPDCMAYLQALNNPKIFRFCAIPQVMAIGTLSLLHNNPKALIENVKLDKATTMEVFTQMENMQDFAKFAMQFLQNFKVKETDIAMQVLLAGYQKDLQQYL